MLNVLRARDGYAGQIVHVESMPHSSAAYQPFRAPLNRLLKHSLDMRGGDRVYTHRTEPIGAITSGSLGSELELNPHMAATGATLDVIHTPG